MRLGPHALAAVAALLIVAATAGAAPVESTTDRTHPPPPIQHGLHATGILPEDPSEDFFVSSPVPVSEAPTEVLLTVGSPDEDRTAEATLVVRPGSGFTEHPLYDDIHGPRFYDFQAHWTKDPGLDDPADATGHHTSTWEVQLEGEPAGIPLEVDGTWTPVDYWGGCTLDSPPPTSCTHQAAGPVALNGTWGQAEVTLGGAALDRYCTVPDDDPTVDTPYTNLRDVEEC